MFCFVTLYGFIMICVILLFCGKTYLFYSLAYCVELNCAVVMIGCPWLCHYDALVSGELIKA